METFENAGTRAVFERGDLTFESNWDIADFQGPLSIQGKVQRLAVGRHR